jgi:phage tail-like protein
VTDDPEHRRAMQASGTAPLVGYAEDMSAARALETPARHGAVRTSRFSVELDGVEVDGFRTVDLPRRYSASENGDQGQGRSRYGPLELRRVLRRGDTQLHDWRTAVEEGRRDAGQKDVTVSLLSETGETVLQWRFGNSWPASYDTPTLDAAAGGEMAMESVTLAFDGVERLADTGPKQQTHGDSGVFRYVRSANAGRVDNGAVVVTASDVGVESVTLGWLDPARTVGGQTVSLLVPEAARTATASDATALWLLPGSELDQAGTPSAIGSGARERLYWLPRRAFFHDRAWQSAGSAPEGEPSREWSIPGWPTEDVRVLVDTGTQSFEATFGAADASEGTALAAQPAQAGDVVDPAKSVFAVVAPAISPFDTPSMQVQGSGPQQIQSLLDAGDPAPLAGATFGLATLSTPEASVVGQSVNPLVGMDTVELFEHEITRRVLAQAGVSDVETTEWLDGPRLVESDGAAGPLQMLGTRTQMESLQGVVSGTDGPWRVGIHVARVTDDSHVIAAGVHRQPLGTAGGAAATAGWQQAVTRARLFTAETVKRLEYI